MSWKFQSYRHSLAARGIVTGKFFAVKQKKSFFAFRDQEREERYRMTFVHDVPEYRAEQLLDNWYAVASPRDVERAENIMMSILHNRTVAREIGVQNYADPSRADVLRARLFAADKVREIDAIHREYMAKKAKLGDYGWKDDGDVQLKGYFEENLRGAKLTPEQRMKKFKVGVKEVLLNPKKDLDGEWQEYTAIAENDVYGPRGKSEKLSKDGVERAQQRSAALVGRVVSQANMEIVIDDERDRTLRESMMDFTFGRRL